MANFIPQELIDRIRDANDVVDVISEYLPLKKRGKNWVGLCPFHPEKKPSFSVSQDKQLFYCFGCGQGGNVVTFLMLHEKVGFFEAITILAKRAGISLPKKSIEKGRLEEVDKIYYANKLANQYFVSSLKEKNLGKKTREYLEKRKVLPESIKLFSIGYAPKSWEGLLNYAKRKGLDLKILEKAGLVVKKEKKEGYYDRFRDRLTFPIFNLSGKIVGFGGRDLSGKDEPKYLNSPETLIYQKSKILYGLNFSKEIIRGQKKAVVVEGYMDLISLYQAGLKNVVASSGTSFTSLQARLLSRYSDETYLFFDSDSAGMSAALRSVDYLFDAGLEVWIVTLPQEEDPDSYVKKFGVKKVLEKLKQAKSFIDFKKDFLNKDFSQLSIKEQEKIIFEFVETAKNIKDEIRQALFIKKVAEAFKIKEELLLGRAKRTRKEKETEEKVPHLKGKELLEQKLLKIFLEREDLLGLAYEKINPFCFDNPDHKKLFEIIVELREKKKSFSPKALVDFTDDFELKRLISKIATIDLGPANLEVLLEDYLKRLFFIQKEKEIFRLKEEIKNALDGNDFESAKRLTFKLQELIKS